MTNRLESTHYSSHFFAATLVSFWLTLCQSTGQSRETAFGQVRKSAVIESFEDFASVPNPHGGVKLYFWSHHGSSISSADLDSLGVLSSWKTSYVPCAIDEFKVVTSLPGPKNTAIAVDRTQKQIFFFSNLTPDTLRPVSQIQLPVSPYQIVFGDLNNDGRTDFIVIDREHPGVYPYFGIGSEKFRAGKVIAEDNAFSAVTLAHLNNDGLIDLLAYDWIRSEIHLLYGIGFGQFLDQSSLAISGDVQSLQAVPMIPGGNLDIVVSYSHPSKFDVLQGDGFGGFESVAKVLLRSPLTSVIVHDVNGDGICDILGVDGTSVVSAFLNNGENSFEDRLDFVAGKGSAHLELVPGPSPGLPDAVTLDRASHELNYFSNGQRRASISDSVDIATPLRPRGVAIADMDGDGVKDVSLVSAGSNLMTVQLNDGEGGMIGPTGFALPASALDVRFHSFVDPAARILISYPESRQISVMSVEMREGTATNATIGTERATEFLYSDISSSAAISFFSFSPPTATASGLLTLFQEIESHQFLERSFRLPAASPLLAASVGLLNSDAYPDVAFVSRNNPAGKTEFSVSWGDSSYGYRQKMIAFEVAEKTFGTQYAWIGPRKTGSRPELLLYRGGVKNVLIRFRQEKENTFSRPDTVATDLKLLDRSQLRLVDLDGDGQTDLVMRDPSRGSIGWMKRSQDGFAPYEVLCSSPGRTFFDIGDLNGDGVKDLAVVQPEQGVLRIYDGAALLRRVHGGDR